MPYISSQYHCRQVPAPGPTLMQAVSSAIDSNCHLCLSTGLSVCLSVLLSVTLCTVALRIGVRVESCSLPSSSWQSTSYSLLQTLLTQNTSIGNISRLWHQRQTSVQIEAVNSLSKYSCWPRLLLLQTTFCSCTLRLTQYDRLSQQQLLSFLFSFTLTLHQQWLIKALLAVRRFGGRKGAQLFIMMLL